MKLIAYISNGYRNHQQTINQAILYAESGVDIIQIDIPSKNPYLEGPVIQERMRYVLEKSQSYQPFLQTLIDLKNTLPNQKFMLLIYDHTVQEIGLETFAQFCLKHNYYDITIIGNEFPSHRLFLQESGLKVSAYVQYHLPKEDLENIRLTNGFIYLQAKPQNKPFCERTLKNNIHALKEVFHNERPIYCGVGISEPKHLKVVKDAGADGGFIGSTLFKQKALDDIRQTIKQFKRAIGA